MEFERLFTALVIGGSMMAGGCASKSTTSDTTNANTNAAQPEPTEQATAANEEEIDCAKVCDMPNGEESREMVCPDPQLGIENCCWLMSIPHECCPD